MEQQIQDGSIKVVSMGPGAMSGGFGFGGFGEGGQPQPGLDPTKGITVDPDEPGS